MRIAMLAITVTAYLLAGCGDEVPGGPAGQGGSSTDSCPTGQVVGPDGACMPVGIQGCAELFIEEDGLCHPSMEKCPAGSIPGFDTGCVSVGIPGCAAVFLEDDGLCHPSMDKCSEGTFAVPTEGCVPIDGPDGCGSGTWGNIPDGPNTVWVDPSYSGGDGDGSQDKPLTTIGAAMQVVPGGGRVALAAGSYAEPVYIHKPVELVGRCPTMVTINGTAPEFGSPVVVAVWETTGVTVRGVQIGGAGRGLMALRAGVRLEQSLVRESMLSGLIASGAGAELVVDHSLITATRPRPDNGQLGHGLLAEDGASTEIVASALAGNHEVGLAAVDAGTTITVTRSLVADTRARPSDQKFGRGIDVQYGVQLAVADSAIVDNHEVGVRGALPGTTITVERSVVAGTRPRPSDLELGRGINIQEGASANILASVVADNHDVGVAALDPGTTVRLERSLVTRTRPQESTMDAGQGVYLHAGATCAVVASAVVANHEVGVAALDPGTTLTLERSLVAGTEPRPGGRGLGYGIAVLFGASATVLAGALAGNHEVGIFLGQPAGVHSSATIDDSLVAGTLPASDGSYGGGVGCIKPGSLSMTRSVVRSNQTVGVLVADGCAASLVGSLVDGVLSGTFHRYVDGQVIATFDGISDGVVVAFGSSATVTDTRVAGCARAGFVFDSSGGLLAGVSTEGARYGLVAQGEPKPDWSDPSNLFNATELAVLTDGELPVPEPPPLPEE